MQTEIRLHNSLISFVSSSEFGKFQHFLIFISGVVMSTTFFETMSVNLALPVAECDLHITSKQQYGIISGMWFAGEKDSSCEIRTAKYLG